MKIHYEWTREDFFAQHDHCIFNQPRNVKGFLTLRWIGSILAVYYQGVQPWVEGRLTVGSVGIGVLVVGFFWVGLPWIYAMNNRLILLLGLKQCGQALLGSFEAELKKDGVRIRSASNEVLIKWESIEKVEENEEYIFLFTRKNAAQALPKRAFGSRDEVQEFLRVVRK